MGVKRSASWSYFKLSDGRIAGSGVSVDALAFVEAGVARFGTRQRPVELDSQATDARFDGSLQMNRYHFVSIFRHTRASDAL